MLDSDHKIISPMFNLITTPVVQSLYKQLEIQALAQLLALSWITFMSLDDVIFV